MAGGGARASPDELSHQEPEARRPLRELQPSDGAHERAQALGLVAFAMKKRLGQALETASTEHPDLVPRTGRRVDEFVVLTDEEAAREAARLALTIADLARQARAEAALRARGAL